MKKLLLLLLGLLPALPSLARTFDYTYEGQTITYTVSDEKAKTCEIAPIYFGVYNEYSKSAASISRYEGNEFSLVLPEHPMDGDIEYTLTAIYDHAFRCIDLHYVDTYIDGAEVLYGTYYYVRTIFKSLTIPPSVKYIGANAFGDSWGDSPEVPEDNYYIDNHGNYRPQNFMAFPEEIVVSSLEHWYSLEWQCNISTITIDGETVNTEIEGDFTFPEGLVRIPAYKFANNSKLTSIIIPESVTSIGEGAFYNCSGLTSVTIPESVTLIGNSAFHSCSGLPSVSIPNSVTEIGSGAFAGCSSLTSVTIPTSVTEIRDWAFSGCNLTSVTIPNSVTEIGRFAFRGCSGLTSVTIGNSVTSIGYEAFSSCSSLTSVNIPESVTYIGGGAFAKCCSLTTVEIADLTKWYEIDWDEYRNGYYYNYYGPSASLPDNVNYVVLNGAEIPIQPTGDLILPEGITHVGAYAFYNCSGLTSVTIPNSVTEIGEGAFSGCSGLTSVTIPNSVTSIGRYAFSGCSGLTSVTIPNSVTSIGWYAFKSCTGLIKAAYPNTFSNPFTSGSGKIISYDPNLTQIMPESGTLYAEDTKTILYVPISATTVTIPEDTKIIGESAFLGCDSLKAITALPYVAPPTILSNNFTDSVYEHCRLIIPDGTYARYMNSEWKNFKNVEVAKPEGDDIKYFDGVFSYSYSPSTKEATLIQGEYSELTTAQIPNRIAVETEDETVFYSVTGIDDGAFMKCGNLTSVKLPKNLVRIGESAFQNCTGLTTIDLPEGVTELGERAFSGCTGLTSVTIPTSVTELGGYAFYGCSGLTSIELPEGLTELGGYAFYGCTSLTSIELPEGLTEISGRAFYGCTNLASVTIPNSVTEIGAAAFCRCWNLTSVTIPDSVTKLGNWAFYWCSGLTSVTIPNSVTTIGNLAFSDCIRLTSITIPNSVTSIGMSAFYDCWNLTSVTIPNSVTKIGNLAFACCTGLTSVNIQDGDLPLDISSVQFDYVKTMHLGRQWPAGFRLPSTLETVSVGNTVSEIPDSTFINCPKLSSLTLGGTVETIGKDAFNGCALQEVVIPPSVKSIGSNAFDGNSSLAEIKIGHGIEEIGEKAFNNCNAIANIYMTADIPPTAQNNTFSYYSSPLWLNDEDAFERYYNYPRCWYRFEDNMYTMKKVESLTADETEMSGEPGDTIKITVTIEPADATLPHIFWSSSDPSVATVDSEGNITFTAESAPAAGSDDPEACIMYDTVKSCVVTARSMYADVPLVEVTLNKTISDTPVEPEPDSIRTISANECATTVYDMRGVRVGDSLEGLPHGVYIIRQGSKTTKHAI